MNQLHKTDLPKTLWFEEDDPRRDLLVRGSKAIQRIADERGAVFVN